jgi:putative MATE family efflux protein
MKLSIDGSLGRRIVALAAPVVAAMISQTLINIADHIMVGRLPSAESVDGQAAVQASVILLWAVGGALSAIAVGTQALTARRFGAGDVEGTGRVLTNSVAISATLGIVCSLVFWKLARVVLPPLVEYKPSVVALGVPFLQWRYLAVLSMAVTSSYKSFFDGLGKTHVHFVVAVVMNVLNLILNFGFIYGMWGFPRMGVPGSGLASCISSYVGMTLIIGWTFRKEVRRFHLYRVRKLSRSVVTEIARLSSPSAAAVIVSLLGFAVFFRIVSRLDAVNAHSIFGAATANLISIMMLVFISCMAYGTAVATLVGHSMGARDYDLAERYAYEAAKIGFSVFSVIGLLTVSAPTWILHLWTPVPEVIAVAAPILRVLGFFLPFMSIALVFMYALYGAGNSFFVMCVEFTLHGLCLVPISWLLALEFGFGMWGAWSAMIAYVVLMAAIMGWKFSSGTWKQIRI